MARGGARPGAGRKKGTVSAQTREKKALADKVAAAGITPLEIMTQTMRDLWEQSAAGGTINMGKRMQAVAIAEKVAPYVHPKLSAVNHSGAIDGSGPVVQVYLPENGRDAASPAEGGAGGVSSKPG